MSVNNYSDNYKKYRGKCKEMSQKLVDDSNGELELVRGYYFEPLWNRDEPHWWCKDKNGVIHDPTKLQFPSGGIGGLYTEFNGIYECANCGAEVEESKAVPCGNYIVCTRLCALKLVGLQ